MRKTRARVSVVPIERVKAGGRESVDDVLAVEEPLQIRLQFACGESWQEESLAVTMRTPGHDFELATGFLFAENVIAGPGDIEAVRYCRQVKEQEQGNVVLVRLARHVPFDMKRLKRHFYVNSSCGVCGKSAIEAVSCESPPLAVNPSQTMDPVRIPRLPAALEKRQTVFRHTGGLHASALFDLQGECLVLREDVGRHNAFDKVVGAALAAEMFPLTNYLMLLSGRVSFELVQKAARAGLPFIAAVGAPSSLAVELAEAKGITLIGFLRDKRFNVYTHRQRLHSRSLKTAESL